jgi:hypothetical protein
MKFHGIFSKPKLLRTLSCDSSICLINQIGSKQLEKNQSRMTNLVSERKNICSNEVAIYCQHNAM